MNCPKCNTPIPAAGRFCPACGTKVAETQCGEEPASPSRTARLGKLARSLSVWFAGLLERARPVFRRWRKNGAIRKGAIAVAIVLVVIVGIRLLAGGRNGEPESSRKDVSLSISSGPSASETLDEFFRLLESLDSEDHYQLENYIRFPTKSETREALGAEKAEEFEEKTEKTLKVMLRSGTISLAWNEVQMRALPASANLTTLEEKKGKDGVVWVNVAIAVNGIVMDEEQSFPLPLRKEHGKWKIDLLCIWKAGEDGTLDDWMNFFHDE